MNCPNCNKTATVAIGTKHFCTNCGTRVDPGVKTTAHTLDLSTPKQAPAPSVATPTGPTKLMRDVAVNKSTHPAGELHSRVTQAKTNVLDLRQAAPAKVEPAPVVAPVSKTPAPEAKLKHISIHAPKMHSPAKAQAEIPATKTPEVRLHQVQKRLEAAGTIHRSEKISRFSPTGSVASPPSTITAPEPNSASSPILTSNVVAQHEHLSRLLEITSDAETAPANPVRKPTKANFATAAVAIAIIGGYIWVHNYPHLAISAAADKAGFSASLPNFVPSSYNLNGPVTYAPGLVTINFTSPSFKDSLKVTQQPTSWDTNSLLANYVTQKSSDYSAITGQGLTIYLFDNGQQATWVNQGIWYTVSGVSHLGRDQLLKMAYSF